MRVALRGILLGFLLVLMALPAAAFSGDPVMYHYDYTAGTLIKNYGRADQESIFLGLPVDSYPRSFAFNESGYEAIFCYTSSTSDDGTFTLTRRNLETGVNLWSTVIEGRECALGQGAYAADGATFTLGIIYAYPWEEMPLAMGFPYGLLVMNMADGSPMTSLDMSYLPELDSSVGWLASTYLNEAGRIRFKMEPRGPEGGGFDGRMFEWDGGTTVSELDATPAKGNSLVTTWGEVYWPEVDPLLPASDSYLAYLPIYNTIKMSYMGDVPRTIYTNSTAVITDVDPIGQDGITVTYIKNASDPDAATYLYERIDLLRDGSIVGPYGETASSVQRVWFMPEMQYANYTDFPTFTAASAEALPTLPAPPLPLGDAPISVQTYHYDFDTQSLISNYHDEAGSASYWLGVPGDRYISSLAVDPAGATVIYCFQNYDTDPITTTITRRDILSSVVYWTRDIEAKTCGLGVGSFSADATSFAMSLVGFDPWDDIPEVVGPYPYSYGLYDASNGNLINQLDMNYVPFTDLSQVYAMETLVNMPGSVVFAARPRVIEGPGPNADVYAWDGGFNVTRLTNERGLRDALVLPWGETFWPEYDPARPAPESYIAYGDTYNVVKQNVGGVTRTIYANSVNPIVQVSPLRTDGILVALLDNPTASEGEMYRYSFLVLRRDGSSYGGFPVVNSFPSFVWVRPAAFTAGPFPDFTFTAAVMSPTVTAPSTTVSCPGSIPLRLRVGGRGRVTPGTPNNLRDNPSTTGARLGQIPGGGAFDIVAGPVCDPTTGIVWWQVVYAGVTGWTAEGQGSDYYTEPLP